MVNKLDEKRSVKVCKLSHVVYARDSSHYMFTLYTQYITSIRAMMFVIVCMLTGEGQTSYSIELLYLHK